MESVGERVSEVAVVTAELAAGEVVTIKPAPAQPCATCPWRRANQTDPPDRPDAVSDPVFYTAEARAARSSGTGLRSAKG